jgi:hypothetical protein
MKTRINRRMSVADTNVTRKAGRTTQPDIRVVIHKAPCYPHWVEVFQRSTSQKGVSP